MGSATKSTGKKLLADLSAQSSRETRYRWHRRRDPFGSRGFGLRRNPATFTSGMCRMAKRPTTFPQVPARSLELKILLPSSTGETSLCNAFFNDKQVLPGFCLCTFGLVLQGQVVNRWCFAFEERNLKRPSAKSFAVFDQGRSIIQVPHFKNPSIPIHTSPVTPRPVDHLALAHQETTAKFAFHGWSWNAAKIAATQIGADKQTIQGHQDGVVTAESMDAGSLVCMGF